MADQQTPKETTSNDEIDLGQFFKMIEKGFNSLFNGFLHIFMYLKRNLLIFIVLAVAGVILGFGLSQIVSKKFRTEVIVKPNLESKSYLYDIVNEIRANIKVNDTSFFSRIGIKVSSLKGYDITIDQPQALDKNNTDDNLDYLEILEKFQENALVTDIIRTEILSKSPLDHRITFSYKDSKNGHQFAKKVMQYINSNKYYIELVKIKQQNALERIRQDESLLAQMDELITRYSNKMAAKERQFEDQKIILDNEKQLDIARLFELKNNLIRDIERKKIELVEQKEAISIIYFGEPQGVYKSFFGNILVLTPLILLAIFLLIDLIKYLNKKAEEIQE